MMSRSPSRPSGIADDWCPTRRIACEADPTAEPGSALAGWKEHRWCWRLHPCGCLTRGSAGASASRLRD